MNGTDQLQERMLGLLLGEIKPTTAADRQILADAAAVHARGGTLDTVTDLGDPMSDEDFARNLDVTDDEAPAPATKADPAMAPHGMRMRSTREVVETPVGEIVTDLGAQAMQRLQARMTKPKVKLGTRPAP